MKKVIVITGGSEGLGYEIAKILAPDNQVVIVAHNPEKLEKSAKEIGCDFEFCDVTKPEDIKTAVVNILKKYGRIDVLINNAGVLTKGELDSNDLQKIREVIDLNTLGTIFFSKEVIPSLKKQKDGLIINIISQGGIRAKAKWTVYEASKFAITGFTKSLQMELAQYGIRVSGVYPGKLNTKIFEHAGLAGDDMSDALDPVKVARAIKFIVDQDPDTVILDIGIKRINN